MFHKLKFDVTFPSTGRRLTQDLDLQSGFWLITGPNESGKSFIFEMLRFALFGSAALRGRADDYKTLKMSAEFTIRGHRYKVTRTTRAAQLLRGDDTVASGVSTVNQKIAEILGYGLPIFDMAHSINQGEVERLGSLTPASRKSLIDGLLGIDALEVVGKWAMEEAKTLDREAAAIRTTLVAPQQPTQPANYVPTSSIDLTTLRADARELAEINGWLSVTKEQPTQPTCSVDLPAENLKVFAEKRKAQRELVAGLEARIAALPSEITYNEAQLNDAESEWERFDRYEEAQRWLKANPIPAHSRGEATDWLKSWVVIDHQRQVDELVHRLSHLDEAECPDCGFHFPLDQTTAEQLHTKIREMTRVTTIVPPEPPISIQACERLIAAWDHFDEAKYREMTAVEALDQPNIPRARIPVLRAQIFQVLERERDIATLLVEKPKLEAMPDYEQMLVERTAYEAALPVYRERVAAYEAWVNERMTKQLRREALQGAQERLQQAEAQYAAATEYEAALERFSAAWDQYQAAQDKADQLEEAAREHRKVRDVMTLLRSMVKQHLMPSLNKVASHLLTQMTGGQRTTIVVDEDFNVVVDGQDLETLSGSGKACANLALRIALGQVLTNRVFSVLMADEIDGSMDDFRAENTSNVLCTLEKTISQVLQVSHKSIESVNQIDLGVFSDHNLSGEAA